MKRKVFAVLAAMVAGLLFTVCDDDISTPAPSPLTIENGVIIACDRSVTSVVIPSGVVSIGNYAFSGCAGLTALTIPSGVVSIGGYAFSGCTGLQALIVPSGVVSIGDYAFSGCAGLTSLILPASIMSAGDKPFAGCANLTVYYAGTKAQWEALGVEAEGINVICSDTAAGGSGGNGGGTGGSGGDGSGDNGGGTGGSGDNGGDTGINGYTLVWQDEFDYTGVPDTSKWKYQVGAGGWGNNELQNYVANPDGTSEAVATAWVDGEALHIKAYNDGKEWKSARMNSRESWTYGIIEARLKVTDKRGTWPAFWMMPKEGTYGNKGWPDNGEIDIMENAPSTCQPHRVFSTLHAQGHFADKGAAIGEKTWDHDLSSKWHTFAIKWDEDSITAYYDDESMGTYNKGNKDWVNWPYDKDFYIILNLAIGGSLGGTADVASLPASGVEFLVDYVRVYQKDSTGGNSGNNGGGADFNGSDTTDKFWKDWRPYYGIQVWGLEGWGQEPVIDTALGTISATKATPACMFPVFGAFDENGVGPIGAYDYSAVKKFSFKIKANKETNNNVTLGTFFTTTAPSATEKPLTVTTEFQ
ncbi:MAG: leucine-rich repeat protein [Treponema sp.]|nr:leucine-rich repeat protein [Treponema sp.]